MRSGADRPATTGGRPVRRWRLVRADPDAVHPAAGGRALRRRMIRLLAGLTILATLGGAGWLVYGTGALPVARVQVTGVHVLTPDEVRAAAGVRIGTPLARLDTGAVERRVSRLAPVARVAVERHWPDSVRIRVTERTPAAVVRAARGYLVLDGSGVVFDEVLRRPRHLPLLDLSRPGPRDGTTRDALRVLTALSPELRRVLVRLAAASPTRITLHLTGDRVVVWGDSEESRQKARVATALLNRPARVIDVSGIIAGSDSDVVTTR